MSPLSFKQYLGVLSEDTAQDIQKITNDISMLDAQLNQRTQPLIARKTQLQKMLAIKQQQKAVEDKRTNSQQPTSSTSPSSNQTTTPGSSGAATPGSAPN
jgi:uncharacterized protein YecT (DUF1311 family)